MDRRSSCSMTDCEDEDDMSRSQSPMIPLTIENSLTTWRPRATRTRMRMRSC